MNCDTGEFKNLPYKETTLITLLEFVCGLWSKLIDERGDFKQCLCDTKLLPYIQGFVLVKEGDDYSSLKSAYLKLDSSPFKLSDACHSIHSVYQLHLHMQNDASTSSEDDSDDVLSSSGGLLM